MPKTWLACFNNLNISQLEFLRVAVSPLTWENERSLASMIASSRQRSLRRVEGYFPARETPTIGGALKRVAVKTGETQFRALCPSGAESIHVAA